MPTLKERLAAHAAWIADGMREYDERRFVAVFEDLRDADLLGADLRGADLRFANLREVDLAGADLRDTDANNCDLRDADLRGADLTDADLTGADLTGADLIGAVGIVSSGRFGRYDRRIFAVDGRDRVYVHADRFGSPDYVIAAIERDYAGDPLCGPYVAAVRAMVAQLEAARAAGGAA